MISCVCASFSTNVPAPVPVDEFVGTSVAELIVAVKPVEAMAGGTAASNRSRDATARERAGIGGPPANMGAYPRRRVRNADRAARGRDGGDGQPDGGRRQRNSCGMAVFSRRSSAIALSLSDRGCVGGAGLAIQPLDAPPGAAAGRRR